MVRGPLALVTAPNPHASGPLHPGPPAGTNGVPRGVANPPDPPGCWKMWRLKMLKNSARKSRFALSPNNRVFLPRVKSSFRPPNERAPASVRRSLPKVSGRPDPAVFTSEKAAELKNGVVAGLKLLLLLVRRTPGTTFTRAPTVP